MALKRKRKLCCARYYSELKLQYNTTEHSHERIQIGGVVRATTGLTYTGVLDEHVQNRNDQVKRVKNEYTQQKNHEDYTALKYTNDSSYFHCTVFVLSMIVANTLTLAPLFVLLSLHVFVFSSHLMGIYCYLACVNSYLIGLLSACFFLLVTHNIIHNFIWVSFAQL